MANKRLNSLLGRIREVATRSRRGDGSDGDLLGRFVDEQDETAFAVLLERHGGLVWSVCKRVLGQAQDAEDACQATFLVLARKAHKVRKRESIASWLHGVAYRISCKQRGKLARRSVREALHAAAADAGADETSVREFRLALDDELAQLPAHYRAPLILCYLEGKTRDEAAAELGCDVEVLRGRLERGRKTLRIRLERRGLTLSLSLFGLLLSQKTQGAAMPALLSVATARAAASIAAGSLSTADVTPQALRLMEDTMKSMFLAKVKVAVAAVLVIAGIASAGFFVKSQGERGGEQQVNAALQAAADKPVDAHGDALPDGAIGRLGTVRSQLDTVSAMEFSDDGKYFVTNSGGIYNKVEFILWDAATGRKLREFGTKIGSGAFAISHDGTKLTGGFASTWYIWDLASGKILHQKLIQSPRGVVNFAFSNDDKTVGILADMPTAVGREDMFLHLFDVETGKLKKKIKIDGNGGNGDIRFSADDSQALVRFGSIYALLDIAKGKVLQRVNGRGYGVLLAPNNRTFMTVDPKAQAILTIETTTGKIRNSVKVPGAQAGKFARNGKALAIVGGMGDERKVTMVTLQGKAIRSFKAPKGTFALSSDASKLLVGSTLYDVATGKVLYSTAGPIDPVEDVAFTPDGKQLIVCRKQHDKVQIWDVKTQKLAQELDRRARRVVLSPDGKKVALGTWSFDLLEPGSWKELASIKQGFGNQIALSPDGKKIAANTRILDAASGDVLHQLDLGRPVISIAHAFSPDGKTVASAAVKGEIHLNEVATGKLIRKLSGHRVGVFALAFSPDGKYLASTATDSFFSPKGDSSVRIWDVASGKQLHEFSGLKDVSPSIRPLAFSPDGKHLVSAFQDNILRVWDVASGKEIRQLPGHDREINGVAFSPDGKTLASASADTTVLIWDLSDLGSSAQK